KRGLRVRLTNSGYECGTLNPANRLSFAIASEVGRMNGMPIPHLLMSMELVESPAVVADYVSGRETKKFLYTIRNENLMFAEILADVNSHPLLTRLSFFKLYRNLSKANQSALVLTLLNFGGSGIAYLQAKVSRFDRLNETLMSLSEPDKLRFLGETNCLNQLL